MYYHLKQLVAHCSMLSTAEAHSQYTQSTLSQLHLMCVLLVYGVRCTRV